MEPGPRTLHHGHLCRTPSFPRAPVWSWAGSSPSPPWSRWGPTSPSPAALDEQAFAAEALIAGSCFLSGGIILRAVGKGRGWPGSAYLAWALFLLGAVSLVFLTMTIRDPGLLRARSQRPRVRALPGPDRGAGPGGVPRALRGARPARDRRRRLPDHGLAHRAAVRDDPADRGRRARVPGRRDLRGADRGPDRGVRRLVAVAPLHDAPAAVRRSSRRWPRRPLRSDGSGPTGRSTAPPRPSTSRSCCARSRSPLWSSTPPDTRRAWSRSRVDGLDRCSRASRWWRPVRPWPSSRRWTPRAGSRACSPC